MAVVGTVPGDAPGATFNFTVDAVIGDGDTTTGCRAPYVHGARRAVPPPGWGRVGEDGTFAMFSRAKLPLPTLDAAALDRLRVSGTPLMATLDLTDERGRPVSGAVRPPCPA